MPHPPMSDEDKRTINVSLKLPAEDLASLSEIAGDETLGAWIRDAAFEEAGLDAGTARRAAPRRRNRGHREAGQGNVSVRLSPREHAALARLAGGEPLGAWIRGAALGKRDRVLREE